MDLDNKNMNLNGRFKNEECIGCVESFEQEVLYRITFKGIYKNFGIIFIRAF